MTLADYYEKLERLTAEYYALLGDPAYLRAHDYPEVLPEPSRRVLADAAAIHFAGPMPKPDAAG